MFNLFKDFWFLFGRLFPFSTRPGLRKIGTPGSSSPVLVTANFELTVRKVVETLKHDGVDAWLLVANTKGINVWCAAGGDNFSTDTVISILKSTAIEQKVEHRKLILPQLCASGVNIQSLQERSGWQGTFGPVDIKYVADWLANGKGQSAPEHKRVVFPLLDRFIMGTNLGFNTSIFAIIPLLITSYWFPGFWWKSLIAIFIAALLNCLFVFKIPGKPGVQKGLWVGGFMGGIFVAGRLFVVNLPLSGLLPWAGWITLLGIYLGYDTPSWSPLWRTDMKELLLGEKNTEVGINYEKCIGCGMCENVCPSEVFGRDLMTRKSMVLHLERCQACGACAENCPTAAIDVNFEGGVCSCPTCQIINKFK